MKLAVVEKVSAKANRALATRSYITGKQTTARPTNHVVYQSKNQGVNSSGPPSEANETSAMVRVSGTRHKARSPISTGTTAAMIIITLHRLRSVRNWRLGGRR